MRIVAKLSIALLVFTMFFQSTNLSVYGASEDNLTELEQVNDETKAIIELENQDEEIPLYTPETDQVEIILYLHSGDEVTIVEEQDAFTLVEYTDPETNEVIQGLIETEHLTIIDMNDDSNHFDTNNPDLETNNAPNAEVSDESSNDEDLDTVVHENDEKELNEEEINLSELQENEILDEVESTQEENNEIDKVENNKRMSTFSANSVKTKWDSHLSKGLALNNPTYIYASESTNSEKLKSYKQGATLLYYKSDGDWYKTGVYINGVKQTGYIHKSHVEDATEEKSSNNQTRLSGVALKNPTAVYSTTSTDSDVLKSYPEGKILLYYTYSSDWYQTGVYINGVKVTGYIHKSHVGDATEEKPSNNQTKLSGVALKSPTAVYSSTSTDSDVLKSYPEGKILLYYTYSSDWYQTGVYINGVKVTGYIHKSHVDNVVSEQEKLSGVALKSPTAVYSRASTNSNALKTYAQGTVLLYNTFSSDWYQTGVYINGVKRTGYIHKSHVENAVSNQEKLSGVALNSPTAVYSRASTSSKALKTYSKGTILLYNTFSSDWYQTGVYINGVKRTGYIHKSHVENAVKNPESLEGRAKKSPTNVYSKASRNSKVLKDYSIGSKMKYKSFTSQWYEATVYVDGKAKTGYIHVNDVTQGEIAQKTEYNYSFKDMVDRQMQSTPKADGAGRVDASRGLVEFFANPLNFPVGTKEFFQFLVLSSPAGLDADEVNKYILNDSAGSLKGQAQAFINAGKLFNMNEAYLIAHALHETGNGKSNLAIGIPVDGNGKVTRDAKGNVAKTSETKHFVYNMYGYGAYDDCPIDCGAKYAFDRGWFTVEDSIIGGANSIYSYIKRGQDTLYKMRWNPDPSIPSWYQYATHVQWATAQTSKLVAIYQMLGNYNAIYDVPVFKNQPDYKDGVYGVVATESSPLTMRQGPGTSYNRLGSIPKGTKIQIIGSDPSGWYNVKYNNTEGWVSATYINLIY